MAAKASAKDKPVKDLSYRNSPDYVPTKEKLAYGCGAFMDGGGVHDNARREILGRHNRPDYGIHLG